MIRRAASGHGPERSQVHAADGRDADVSCLDREVLGRDDEVLAPERVEDDDPDAPTLGARGVLSRRADLEHAGGERHARPPFPRRPSLPPEAFPRVAALAPLDRGEEGGVGDGRDDPREAPSRDDREDHEDEAAREARMPALASATIAVLVHPRPRPSRRRARVARSEAELRGALDPVDRRLEGQDIGLHELDPSVRDLVPQLPGRDRAAVAAVLVVPGADRSSALGAAGQLESHGSGSLRAGAARDPGDSCPEGRGRVSSPWRRPQGSVPTSQPHPRPLQPSLRCSPSHPPLLHRRRPRRSAAPEPPSSPSTGGPSVGTPGPRDADHRGRRHAPVQRHLDAQLARPPRPSASPVTPGLGLPGGSGHVGGTPASSKWTPSRRRPSLRAANEISKPDHVRVDEFARGVPMPFRPRSERQHGGERPRGRRRRVPQRRLCLLAFRPLIRRNVGVVDGGMRRATPLGTGLKEPITTAPAPRGDDKDFMDLVGRRAADRAPTSPGLSFFDPLEGVPHSGSAVANGFVGGDVLRTSAGSSSTRPPRPRSRPGRGAGHRRPRCADPVRERHALSALPVRLRLGQRRDGHARLLGAARLRAHRFPDSALGLPIEEETS